MLYQRKSMRSYPQRSALFLRVGILVLSIGCAPSEPLRRNDGVAPAVPAPAPHLSMEARRQVIRQRIAASPFAEVKQEAEQVEAAVLSTGHYAVDLTKHPPVRGWLNTSRWPKVVLMALEDL